MGRDIAAGLIAGSMAIPLSVGIAMMSEFPIKVGLATVAFACLIGWINAWFQPGNYIGCPGIAAGLAPVLAVGVSSFGIENMAFAVFLTAIFQAVIWKFNWQRYLLVAVPVYLVEGLLAGVGLKIALKFLAFTYELPAGMESADSFLNGARIQMILISMAGYALFVYLFLKFKNTQPAVPYFVIIAAGTILAQFMSVPMLSMEDTELKLAWPIPHFDSALTVVYMVGFAVMLALIDVIEQVMSNAAIEKIDPLKRKCNSNNSLFAIWIANMGSSFFGGMTNLDGLAKSTTNRLAGAYTKFSVLIIWVCGDLRDLQHVLPDLSAEVCVGGDYDLLRVEDDRGTGPCDPSRALCHDPGDLVRPAGLQGGHFRGLAGRHGRARRCSLHDVCQSR